MILVATVAIAVIGPFIAPNSPTAIVGIPYDGPSWATPLGTDSVGRDVLSRVLWGGRGLLLLGFVATAVAYLIAGVIGLFAGYSRSVLSPILMRANDVLLAFPTLLLLLLVVAGLGAGTRAMVIGIILLNVPGAARILHTATLEVSHRGFVEAAEARGEATRYVLSREILPNIVGPIAADAGPRLIFSILAIASLSFLGVGVPPPTANWALMVSENRVGLAIQPWSVAAPAVLIAALAVGAILSTDAFARGRGWSSTGSEASK
jgi:peptide/nickel transport system permease protein